MLTLPRLSTEELKPEGTGVEKKARACVEYQHEQHQAITSSVISAKNVKVWRESVSLSDLVTVVHVTVSRCLEKEC